MTSLPSGTRIWLVAGVTDMRKSFNGLGELVQHALDENPFSGHLFIFRGRKGDTVKILWADANDLCLFTKQLEEGSSSDLLYATAKSPSPAHSRRCSSISWTGASQKQHALTH
ncbi:TPA: IS66 family insertion sequence element accessory protein TnpB [Enterobacter cloacae]|nr:IS66 family insertion sequence element accessory protein TnpB [Enterobacter cloacae complex sp. P31C]HEW9972861.1 IS66 family insertion sequence element accessory protein TnpB [Enterobacter cloacae]